MLKQISIACIFVLCTQLANANTSVLILDQDGLPVKNAVITTSLNQHLKPPTDIAIMDQRGKNFEPRVLLIEQGQSVKFPNSDNIRHHVYSFSKAKTFEIKLYNGVPSSPVVFEQPGIVVLGCNIHDSMVGYIYVNAVIDNSQPVIAITNEMGIANFNIAANTLGVPANVKIWHENLASNIVAPVSTTLIYNSDKNYLIGNISLFKEKQESKRKTIEKRFGR